MIEILTFLYLSQVAIQTDSGISPEAVGSIIGAVIVALIGGGVIGKKVSDARKMTVGPQPFMVKMTEEFVTRREFTELKATIEKDFTKMEGLFSQTMQKVDLSAQSTQADIARTSADLAGKLERQNERLTDAVAVGIDEGRKGRVALWNELNPVRSKVEAIGAKQDVAEQIGKLGEAILKTQPHKPSGR